MSEEIAYFSKFIILTILGFFVGRLTRRKNLNE